MIYLIFTVIAILTTTVVGILAARMGVADIGGLYKPCKEEITPFNGKKLIVLTLICLVCALGIQISLYINTSVINFIKLYGMFVIVFSAGVIDAKRRIIPNFLIIFGLVFRLGIYVYEFISKADMKAILINDMIGFGIGFVLLAIVSILSRGSLGFGDVKLFGIIGMTCGSFGTYTTLLLSLIISVVYALIKLLTKKMSRKDSFPFGPCIAVGYILTLLLTSY